MNTNSNLQLFENAELGKFRIILDDNKLTRILYVPRQNRNAQKEVCHA